MGVQVLPVQTQAPSNQHQTAMIRRIVLISYTRRSRERSKGSHVSATEVQACIWVRAHPRPLHNRTLPLSTTKAWPASSKTAHLTKHISWPRQVQRPKWTAPSFSSTNKTNRVSMVRPPGPLKCSKKCSNSSNSKWSWATCNRHLSNSSWASRSSS